jgi:hypothetical protein
MLDVKLAGFLLVLAAIPAGAQSGFEHGHKLGTTVTALMDPGDVREGTPLNAFVTNGAGQASPIQIVIRLEGSAIQPANRAAGKEPCAAFETWVEQATSDFAESAGSGVGGIERTEGKMVLQRFVRDNLRQIYASYTVTVETLPDKGMYRVSLGPPEPPADILGKGDWKVFSPAKYPLPQIVRDEDTIRLELYSNGTSRRVVDYIHAGRQDQMVMRKETPHDYYADDAEFAVTQPRLRVNGVASDAIATMPETIRGPALWVYIPGHGRFVLSPHAHSDLGFEDAGEAAGNSLRFTAPDGNVFRIDTAERVAAGSGSYAVYVLADSGWTPADPQDRDRVMIGASLGVIGR